MCSDAHSITLIKALIMSTYPRYATYKYFLVCRLDL